MYDTSVGKLQDKTDIKTNSDMEPQAVQHSELTFTPTPPVSVPEPEFAFFTLSDER